MLAILQDIVDYLIQTAGYVVLAFGKFNSLDVIAYVIGGTLLGIVIGVLPGLTATMGLALLTTLTYKLDPNAALLSLMCLYVGAIYGGSRTAILLNIPGTPANAATTLDGYPLARMGRADRDTRAQGGRRCARNADRRRRQPGKVPPRRWP